MEGNPHWGAPSRTGRPCASLPIPSKREQEAGTTEQSLLLALSHCSPSLLLVYPPTASLGKVRPDGLSRDFMISAKFPSMGNFKNRLTATQTPNWVAPFQESHPSSKTVPPRRGSVALSLPTLHSAGTTHPQLPFFNRGRAFPMGAGSYLPCNSCLPCIRQAPSSPPSVVPALKRLVAPTRVFLAYPALRRHHPSVPTPQ